MKRIITTLSLLFITTINLQAQKKSELFLEIKNLKTELDSTKTLVVEARKNERVSLTKSESYESQVKELQAANATLLQNLSNFAKVSNKNSDNINKALASLEQKENQFKDINDAIASNDSIALVVYTKAKDSIVGAGVTVANGAVVISASLTALFSDDTSTVISETAHPLLEKIAAIIIENPKMSVTIEGLSMTGELDLAAQKAIAVSNFFQTQHKIESSRLIPLGVDGNFKEGISIKLHPNYNAFYTMVKENMKGANKN